MAAREQPYDPYIPSGHSAQNGGIQHQGEDSRTAALQKKINETVGIMKHNLTASEQRGENIDKIGLQAENMNQQSTAFRNSARKVKRKMCMSNLKWWFILAGVVALIILVSVIAAVEHNKKNH